MSFNVHESDRMLVLVLVLLIMTYIMLATRWLKLVIQQESILMSMGHPYKLTMQAR
jgi:hypothetical protein